MDPKTLIYMEKASRDLMWVVNDPLLMTWPLAEKLQKQLRDQFFGLKGYERDHIVRELALRFEQHAALGRWFETLLDSALCLKFSRHNVHKNLSDGAGGELDFVVTDGQRVLQIECAVKFFLNQDLSRQDLTSFVGPAGKDRLDLKYLKMRDVQLKRAVPEDIRQKRDVEAVLWMSGCLFYPARAPSVALSGQFAEGLSRRHSRGVYGQIDEVFESLGVGDLLVELGSTWWLTSLNGFPAAALDFFKLYEFEDGKRKMVARLRIVEDHIVELGRGFVH